MLWRRLWDWRWLTATLIFLAVAAPWYVWVAVETKGVWVAGFWNKHNADRFTGTMEGHGGPFYYYLLVLLAGCARLPKPPKQPSAAWVNPEQSYRISPGDTLSVCVWQDPALSVTAQGYSGMERFSNSQWSANASSCAAWNAAASRSASNASGRIQG